MLEVEDSRVFKIEITYGVAKTIAKALGKFAFEDVAWIIWDIQRQIDEQLDKPNG
jgi:hypothetical protein